MAKRSATPKMTWHFFLPAVVGGVIAWLFSQSMVLGVEVFVVVLVVEFLARWMEHK